MAFDYLGSLTQKYIQFITSFQVITNPGENFNRVMIFLATGDKAAYFVTPPADDTCTEVTAYNYAQVTLGKLKTWLDGFYASGTVAVVEIVVVANIIADLTAQFAAFDERAYWKTFIGSVALNQLNGGVALATLCAADTFGLSQFFWGSNDATILTGTEDNEHDVFEDASLDVPLIYHPSSTQNGALVQLGAAMAAVNASGIYVGNKLDWVAISGWSASGTAGANLTAAQIAQIQTTYHDSFFTTIGDGSGRVAAEKWQTPLGTVIGAVWVKNYVDVVSAILVAAFLVTTAQGGFKNNDTYQGILGILQQQLNKFTATGRLTNMKITAPTFNNLPPASGGVITIPHAWRADYVDNVRQVTVYGTLTIAV